MGKVTKVRRALLCVVAACVMVFGLTALAGCGANEEEQVRQQVTADLDAIKNLDDAMVQEVVAAAADEGVDEAYEMFGITTEDVVRAYLDGFDYTIDGVTIDGDTAQVTVTMTMKSEADVTSALETMFNNLDMAEVIEAGDFEFLGSHMIDTINAVESTPQEPVTVEYVKADGAWAAASNIDSSIAGAVL